MLFRRTSLAGAFLILPDRKEDERGFFERIFSERRFQSEGIDLPVLECAISYNRAAGTLRGMHYQLPPQEQAKLIRCIRGSMFDVLIDLRPDSPTYCRWEGNELSARDGLMVFVPEGFAHGFQTLEPDTEVLYQMSKNHDPARERGIRYDDPAFGIKWPLEVTMLSDRDRSFPDYAG